MSLKDPLHDFLDNSIHGVNGKLNRLAYLADLRGQEGDYEHWGMERTYGKQVASGSMSTAHSLVWLDLLRTRIQDLEQDSVDEMRKGSSFTIDTRMIPADTAGAIPGHFRFLIKTLNQLARHPR